MKRPKLKYGVDNRPLFAIYGGEMDEYADHLESKLSELEKELIKVRNQRAINLKRAMTAEKQRDEHAKEAEEIAEKWYNIKKQRDELLEALKSIVRATNLYQYRQNIEKAHKAIKTVEK